jgi:acyl-CoA synthetase (AMP-forming)/AMP-acid ligase II
MRTIGELIERNEKMYPDREALVCGDRRITYGELASRARRLADGLHRLGMRRQDRVAILAMNCPEYMELFAAGDWAGYIVATVNFRLAAPEIEWLVNDSSPRVLVFEAQYAGLVDELRPRLKSVAAFVCIGGPAPDWAQAFETVVASGVAAGPPFRSQPEDFGPLVYTSGTTGRPKGALRSQWRWVETAEGSAGLSDMGSDTRVLLTTPAFHVGVIGYAVASAWRGGLLVLHRQFDPVAVLDTIERERITFTFMVAAMLQAVVDTPAVDRRDFSSIRMIVTAAAPVPVPLLRRGIEVIGPVFGVQFGSTETAGTGMFPNEINAFGSERELRRIASVGRPGVRNRIRVVDDDGHECKVGQPGEVLTFTDQRFDGYWNNTSATLETLRDGWLHTGDVGYLDEDGYLFLVDRKKDMIISGGENIYSREVENAVLAHPAVLDCAAVGVPHERWGEAVKVYVVLRPDQQIEAEALIAHCRTLIASYKCPKAVEAIDELPRVASGKVNKVALRELSRAAAR